MINVQDKCKKIDSLLYVNEQLEEKEELTAM
jgi:hypothetical protein